MHAYMILEQGYYFPVAKNCKHDLSPSMKTADTGHMSKCNLFLILQTGPRDKSRITMVRLAEQIN